MLKTLAILGAMTMGMFVFAMPSTINAGEYGDIKSVFPYPGTTSGGGKKNNTVVVGTTSPTNVGMPRTHNGVITRNSITRPKRIVSAKRK